MYSPQSRRRCCTPGRPWCTANRRYRFRRLRGNKPARWCNPSSQCKGSKGQPCKLIRANTRLKCKLRCRDRRCTLGHYHTGCLLSRRHRLPTRKLGQQRIGTRQNRRRSGRIDKLDRHRTLGWKHSRRCRDRRCRSDQPWYIDCQCYKSHRLQRYRPGRGRIERHRYRRHKDQIGMFVRWNTQR